MLFFDYLGELANDWQRLSQRSRRLAIGLISLAALILVIGCWRGFVSVVTFLGRSTVPVSGHVWLGGEPLAAGIITFHSTTPGGDAKPVAGAAVVQGRFTVPGSPGIHPGRYLVRIRSPQAMPHDGLTTPPAEERIPPEFNDHSSQVIEVRRYRLNVFSFSMP